jgi:hypothetical protein
MLAVRSRRRLMGQDGTDPVSTHTLPHIEHAITDKPLLTRFARVSVVCQAYVGVSVSESKRGKGRRVGKDVNGAPLDLRGELDNRGLLSSLKKQQQDLTVLQDIYKRGGFYAPVLIEVRPHLTTLLYSTWWQEGMRAVEEKR